MNTEEPVFDRNVDVPLYAPADDIGVEAACKMIAEVTEKWRLRIAFKVGEARIKHPLVSEAQLAAARSQAEDLMRREINEKLIRLQGPGAIRFSRRAVAGDLIKGVTS